MCQALCPTRHILHIYQVHLRSPTSDDPCPARQGAGPAVGPRSSPGGASLFALEAVPVGERFKVQVPRPHLRPEASGCRARGPGHQHFLTARVENASTQHRLGGPFFAAFFRCTSHAPGTLLVARRSLESFGSRPFPEGTPGQLQESGPCSHSSEVRTDQPSELEGVSRGWSLPCWPRATSNSSLQKTFLKGPDSQCLQMCQPPRPPSLPQAPVS